MQNTQPEKSFLELFEDILLKNGAKNKQEAKNKALEIEKQSQALLDNNNPEIQERLEILSQIPQEELIEEIGYLLQDIATNNYSETELYQLTNEIFNIVGFKIEPTSDGASKISTCELQY